MTFGAYAVVFWLLAWARFTTKDVTSSSLGSFADPREIDR